MNKRTILIVENDEDEQFFMKEAFEASGLFELSAILKNGNMLFDWLEHNTALPDVILSDLNMPGKNGYDILSEIKSNPVYAGIPVIITSTSSTKNTIDKCYALGAADYMAKPDTFIDYSGFVQRLYDLINTRHLTNKQ